MKENKPLSEDLQQILNSVEVQNFLKAVEQFNELQRAEDIDVKEFINQSCFSLTELYYRGRLLPEFPLKYSSTDDYRPNLLSWEYANTIDKLEDLQMYYAIKPYPAYKSKEAPSVIKRSLSNDLSDIVFDVNICLGLMSEGTDKAVEQALFVFKVKFDCLLGILCLEVIRVLQYIKFWVLPGIKDTTDGTVLPSKFDNFRVDSIG
ncbi:MAG: DUF5063 domain-containing protein [Bacteroidota bacterium]